MVPGWAEASLPRDRLPALVACVVLWLGLAGLLFYRLYLCFLL